jgi:hypothetical protein
MSTRRANLGASFTVQQLGEVVLDIADFLGDLERLHLLGRERALVELDSGRVVLHLPDDETNQDRKDAAAD